MGLVHSVSGAYIRFSGRSVAKGISFSRGRRNFALAREFLWGTLTEISDPAKIPIQDLGVQKFQKFQKSWIFKVLCFA